MISVAIVSKLILNLCHDDGPTTGAALKCVFVFCFFLKTLWHLCVELEVFDLSDHLLQNDLGSLLVPLVWAGTISFEGQLSWNNWNYHNLPSKEHGVFVKQPGGQTTKLPLSTDVRPWPKDIFFIFSRLLFPQMYGPGLKIFSLHPSL